MRRADDLADSESEDGRDPLQRIETFRAATDAALDGRIVDDDPLWIALAETADTFEVDREALHAMIDGQVQDISGRVYETFDEVREYCYRVASTVGLVCIKIWGYQDPAACPLAVDRGIAFQLTNILRDYREDYDAGRVYLPAEDFERYEVTPLQLRRWADPVRCRQLVLAQVGRAKSFYRRSAPLDRMITGSCRPTLWAMTTIYRTLLKRIEQMPWRIVLARRVCLSPVRKSAIALRARWLAKRTLVEGGVEA